MSAARDLLDDLAVIGATIEPAGDRLLLRAGLPQSLPPLLAGSARPKPISYPCLPSRRTVPRSAKNRSVSGVRRVTKPRTQFPRHALSSG
jgi:hypothetical protein